MLVAKHIDAALHAVFVHIRDGDELDALAGAEGLVGGPGAAATHADEGNLNGVARRSAVDEALEGQRAQGSGASGELRGGGEETPARDRVGGRDNQVAHIFNRVGLGRPPRHSRRTRQARSTSWNGGECRNSQRVVQRGELPLLLVILILLLPCPAEHRSKIRITSRRRRRQSATVRPGIANGYRPSGPGLGLGAASHARRSGRRSSFEFSAASHVTGWPP